MDPKTFGLEKNHLSQIIDTLSTAKVQLEKSMEVIGAQTLDRLKDLREDPQAEPHDLLFLMEQLQEKHSAFNFKDKYKRLEEFTSLLKEPYFSRIDLKEGTEESKPFYIGKFGYTEKTPLIIDWRAKLASVYYRYRYPQKNVSYDTPDGIQTRDLTLKRTYEIDNANLLKYYNNDIQFDENDIIVSKIEHRTGGVLEDIVETIQESQLDIIEADPRQICIVQGSVGSGKSTVAIHKLSHIFFNFPELIHPERSILVAKSQILIGYLSTLFPKLGIFDVSYKSLRELVYNLVFREELGLDIDLDLNPDIASFGLDQIRAIREKILELHDKYEADINAILSEDEFTVWAGYIYNRKIPVYENFSELLEELEEELELQKGYLKEYPNSTRSYTFRENIKSLKKLVNKLKKVRLSIKETTLNELCKKLSLPVNGKMGYLDTLIYMFVYSELVGLKNTRKYEYCVVDEGQDFGVLEYLVLSKFVLNGRFCILGDLNQSFEVSGLSNWDDISKVVPEAKKANTFELDTNYRSTKPIIDLANEILSPYTQTYLPKSINRKGNPPEIVKFESEDKLFEQFSKSLVDDTKELKKSVGVIVFDKNLLKRTEEEIRKLNLPDDRFIVLDSKKKITYLPNGVYLVQFEDSKGLEFAKVYVMGLNLDKVHTFPDAKKAFISVTRAMNELSVYSL